MKQKNIKPSSAITIGRAASGALCVRPGWSGPWIPALLQPLLVPVLAALICLTQPASAQPLFLADTTSTPIVEISWPDQRPDAEPIRLRAERPYAHDSQRESLGENLSVFVALGGTRMRMGAGHPRSVSVKLGVYKIDPLEPMFRDLPPGGMVTLVLSNLRFQEDPFPLVDTPMQHLRYDEADLESCGISATARNQYNIFSPTDLVNNRIRPDIDTRQGVLDGSTPTDGQITLTVEPDNSVTMRAKIPYWMFRHLSDPWRTDIPGTFIEPYHFHIEFEVIPASVAESEQASADPPISETPMPVQEEATYADPDPDPDPDMPNGNAGH